MTVTRQAQIHRLRHVIKELADFLPETLRSREDVRQLTAYGCLTRMHVVRLLAPGLVNEDQTKDVDFSPDGIRQRWEVGYEKAIRMIELAPWKGEFDPLEGVFLHDLKDSVALEDMAPEPAIAPQCAIDADCPANLSER